MQSITDHGGRLGIRALCAALWVARATYYRQRQPGGERRPRRRGPRALTPVEHQRILTVLHEPRFADRAPGQV